MKPFIDRNACFAEPEDCQAMPACPDQAIRYIPDEKEPRRGRMVVDETICTGCGSCALSCCGDAITMK
jgi:Pyruvate/2-oxoacid:ferredoxin oxidoreductase delta subunit